MSDVRLIDANVVISYIDDCIAESREEREDAKSRGNDCEVNYNAGEIQMARRIKRQINLGTPTIDAVPVVHGQWLTSSDVPDTLICSACGRRFDMYHFDQKDMPYCLCGCKMDLGEANV